MKNNPVILSIQYGGHDTAAALMIGGEIAAACEQERYSLDKHTREFPSDAIADCLRMGGVTMDDVDEIAFCSDPIYYIRETYLRSALEDIDRIGFLIQDIDRVKHFYNLEELIRENTGFSGNIEFHLHHLCHIASSYYASGFDNALLVSFDGMGEIETGLIGCGRGDELEVLHCENRYPDSFGLLYSAVTHYLGYKHHCDEGIIMGLASYGDPYGKIPGTDRTYYSVFEEILKETGDYTFEVGREWIAYHKVRDTWISGKFTDMFGPKRKLGEPLTCKHENIASALQQRLEDVVINQLNKARTEFGFARLCLAGGVALNCSMNGKIEAAGIFDEIFVQPASGDNGATIGACFLSHKKLVGNVKIEKRHNTYQGSGFDDAEIEAAFKAAGIKPVKGGDIFQMTAEKLADGKIVGWFQGRAEFGPRALGNRSILTRPFPAEMKDYLNKRVKFREEFRPFAPAVLAEHSSKYFKISQDSPHMLIASQASGSAKDDIPAVVHVDNSCRVQMVTDESNPQFRKLIEAFQGATGCPVVLNTSFNVKGQPIVNTPSQAIECFKSTNIDFLVIGEYYAENNCKQ